MKNVCKKCKGSGLFKDEIISFAGGSMGMGLPAAVGFALAKKLKGEEGTVYCLMSDGELQVGTTWEAALIAAQHKLNNLVVLVDRNGLQAMGKTEDILPTRFPNYGWNVFEGEGHNYRSLELIFLSRSTTDKPTAYLLDTVKGKGVSFMEGANIYHYKAPSEEEYIKALEELING